MNKMKYGLLTMFLMSGLIWSCSKSESSSPDMNGGQVETSSGPDAGTDEESSGEEGEDTQNNVDVDVDPEGVFWRYNNVYDSASVEKEGRELLSLNGDFDSQMQFTSDTSAEGIGGFLTGALANGQVSIEGKEWVYSGLFNFMKLPVPDGTFLMLNLPVENMPLVDPENKEEKVLFKETLESDPQKMSIVVEGKIVLSYEIEVTQKEPQSVSAGGETFEDAIPIEIAVSNVSTALAIHQAPVEMEDYNIIEEGDNQPIISTGYFVEGIGFVKSETRFDIPFKRIGEVIKDALHLEGEIDPSILSMAPDLKPTKYTVTQDLIKYRVE